MLKKSLKMWILLTIGICIVAACATPNGKRATYSARAAAKTPEVWLAVLPVNTLVQPGAQWDFVKHHVDGIKFWPMQLEDEAPPWSVRTAVNTPEVQRKLIAELKRDGIPIIIEKGNWPPQKPNPVAEKMGGKSGPYDDTFGERAAENDVERIRRLKAMGGNVTAFDVDGPIRHMLHPRDGQGFATIELCAQEFTKYMMGVHAAYPKIGFYALTNFPNWGYRGDASYWGLDGHGDYFTAVEAIIRNAKAAGAPLRGITVDNPYDFAVGEVPLPPNRKVPAGYDPKKIDWIKRILDLEHYVHTNGLEFNLIINSQRTGVPLNKKGPVNTTMQHYNKETLDFLDLYQKRGGRPDRYIVQSWYVHPRPDEVLPETSPDTFTGLVKEAIMRVKGAKEPLDR